MIRLVVGLGNPGPEYAATRHNVGYRTVDLLAGEAGASWKPSPAGEGLCAEARLGDRPVRLAKALTYMNASGEMVGAAARFWKIPPAEVLIVSDDIDLPLGRIRIRLKGSSGGQRGLESVLSHLGTREVPRVRLGVGPKPAQIDAASFVLGRFRPDEREAGDGMIARAAEAVAAACSDGIEKAMNRYNPAEGEAA
ncbi:MAG: aminoacyl-tRNA hydrolase [Elusimicrobiota bacterium]|jgi:PTH1 family peptidyl-tRNA hydrolase